MTLNDDAFADELLAKIEKLSQEKVDLVREVAELKVASQQQSKQAELTKQQLETAKQELKMKQQLQKADTVR